MTTATTKIFNENGEILMNMLRLYDGYPSVHGNDIYIFLKNKVIVNGYGIQPSTDEVNGMDELAAKFICHFKNEFVNGNIYLTTMSNNNASYNYSIYYGNNEFIIVVDDLFKGNLQEFLGFISNYDED